MKKTKNTKVFNFFVWVLFKNYSKITGLQGKGKDVPLIPHYYLHPLHRHLDISRVITAESLPLHIGSRKSRTGKICFPIAMCKIATDNFGKKYIKILKKKKKIISTKSLKCSLISIICIVYIY